MSISALTSALLRFVKDVRSMGLMTALKGSIAKYGRGETSIKLTTGKNISIRCRNSDYSTLRQVFGDEEYQIGNAVVESDIIHCYQGILAAGNTPVIIDAGANIGLASLWFKSRFPKAAIVAIEPDPQNYEMLSKNVPADDLTSLQHAALGSREGFVSLSNHGLAWAVQTERTDQQNGVPIITIDQAANKVSKGVLLLVKIDIEGFESDLFSENLDWLDRVHAVFIEPHDWMNPKQNSSATFQRAFGARNFNVYVRGENLLYVKNG